MRVEQDLRIVIKAAANAAKARALVKAILAADAAERRAREQLQKQFGLNRSSWQGNGEFTMGDEKAFQKAGGEIGVKRPKFTENEVIAAYAAAPTKQAAEKVLQRYGIVWK